MARSRRHADDLSILVAASSDLREVLNLAEGAALAAASTRTVLHARSGRAGRAGIGCGPGRAFLRRLLRPRHRRGRVPAKRRATAAVSRSRSSDRRVSSRWWSRSASRAIPVTDQIVRLVSSEFGGRLEQLRLLEALGEQTLARRADGCREPAARRRAGRRTAARRLAVADRRRPLQGRQRHPGTPRRRPPARATRRASAPRLARPRRGRALRRRRVPRAAPHPRR